MLSNFFEWLASNADGAHQVTTTFMVFATASLIAFGALAVITGKLVVDAWKALRDERRARQVSLSQRERSRPDAVRAGLG